jgi:hypothetical protein
MGSFYTFWEARLLSMIQHWIGKKPGVESARLLIYIGSITKNGMSHPMDW